MNVILFGYRGSGKTTIGKLLAEQLWKTFADVDQLTCKHFQDDSIAHIWEVHGETAWREAEVAVTQKLCAQDEQVIALGGGTLMQQGARDAVEQCADARRIYLACHPEELARRISADANSAATRPSLTGKGGQAGDVDEVRQVLRKRDPVYRAVADVVFDVTHLQPDDAVRYLIQRCL